MEKEGWQHLSCLGRVHTGSQKGNTSSFQIQAGKGEEKKIPKVLEIINNAKG